ncbi:MAG TPA: hypothetical protein VK786_00790, partial [bacterium]|nr:hypothetical protein [bacterium]
RSVSPSGFTYYSEDHETAALRSNDPFRVSLAKARLKFIKSTWNMSDYDPGRTDEELIEIVK